MTPDPEVNADQPLLAGPQLEILHPASEDGIQCFADETPHVPSPPHMKQVLYTGAEPPPALVRHTDAHPAPDLQERESEKTSFPRTRYRALVLVDLEFQYVLNVARDRTHGPVPSLLTPYIDVHIVCIATETVSSAFQFLVQTV